MGRLAGKVALITGGARGMGAAHVRTFLREGAEVVFGDVLEPEGRALAAELGQRCRFVPHDVTDEDRWIAAVRTATSAFGRLDVLVNNAGVLRAGSIEEMTVADFRAVLEVNAVGQWLGVKHASRAMGPGGSIVNVSSVAGLVGGAGVSAYSASKFAVRGITRSAALELGPRGIRVNSVHPGGVATAMTGRDPDAPGPERAGSPLAALPIARAGAPAEVAELVLFLAAEESGYCTGAEFVVDGGMTAGAGF
ncbi:glucose 1-dehydrogenase [Saccharopolyspora cebuensis]|uniref:Glucose 1-dehydrogenase n=1 Tax=Saccharopolyspora cebuensis TaxID=418759 RepID=A0ABV4CGD2_9PSEU